MPDPAVPAGTCTAVACTSYGSGGQSCIAANNLTSLNGTTIQGYLTSAQNATLSADQNITSFTLNADGSIASQSGNTAGVLQSSVGDQGLSANSASLVQSAPQSTSLSGGTPAIGEEEAVGTEIPGTQNTVVTTTGSATAQATPVSVSADTGATAVEPTPDTSAATTPATTPTTQATAQVDTTVSTQPQSANLNGLNPRHRHLIRSISRSLIRRALRITDRVALSRHRSIGKYISTGQ